MTEIPEIPYGYCQCGCGQKTRVPTNNDTRQGWTTGVPLRFVTGHNGLKHGHWKKQTGAYKAWRSMMSRCYGPGHTAYPYYGGRGITVCERWHQFENFYADMGDRPEAMSLDRIDNNGNYEPRNCRWATRSEQQHNTRQMRHLEWHGKIYNLKSLARHIGMNDGTLEKRLNNGMSVEAAVTTPVAPRKRSVRYNGKRYTVTALAEHTGLKFTTLLYRLDRGWSVKQAVTTPLGPTGPK